MKGVQKALDAAAAAEAAEADGLEDGAVDVEDRAASSREEHGGSETIDEREENNNIIESGG
jgi:hypothetical protein